MKITENLELDQEDLERILTPYIRSYRFYNKGTLPESIIIEKAAEIKFQSDALPPKFVEIPVEFKEVPRVRKVKVEAPAKPEVAEPKGEIENAPSGLERAERPGGADESVSPSDDAEPKPDTT